MAKNLFSAHNISKTYHEKVLFENISIGIAEGERIGLIGRNGVGKSSLLKIIAGLDSPDNGIVTFNKEIKTEYLSQLPEFTIHQTALQAVMGAKPDILKARMLYDELCMDKNADDPQIQQQLHDISIFLDSSDGWTLDTQAAVLLGKLGLKDLHKDVYTLSGGQRKRVALARALLSEPDLLILDEPTNHLDADSVQWLQDNLQQSVKGLLLVTHDRYFLDAVSTRIVELDQRKLFSYDGNFEFYLLKKEARLEVEEATAEHERNKLRTELAWLQKGAKARRTKQKSRIDWIAKMQAEPKREELKQIKIELGNRFLGGKLIDAVNISKSLNDKILFKDFTYRAAPGDRIGIIGPNGAGKSTLLNILSGRMQPDAGYVNIGETVSIGYFDQEIRDLKESNTVIANLREIAEYIDTGIGRDRFLTAKDLLDRFLFPARQHHSLVSTLSGGEKRRLALLRILMGNPNVLMFDEPTNDFDINTLSALEDYIQNFYGVLIIVSHDRAFLDRTVERIYAFEEDGKIKEYPGNYSAYLEKKEEIVQRKTEEKVNTIVNAPRQENKNQKKGLTFAEKKEFALLEQNIASFEQKKADIEQFLSASNTSDYKEITARAQELAQIDEQLEEYMLRWLELSEKDK
jgi:ATP-binding cassette subfamily F protein uup